MFTASAIDGLSIEDEEEVGKRIKQTKKEFSEKTDR
jgi:hypothetical protein